MTNRSVSVLYLSSNTLYAWTDSGVFKNIDGGDSWISTGLTDHYVLTLYKMNDTLYAGTWKGVFRLIGGSWLSIGLTDRGVTSLCSINGVLGEVLYAGTFGGGVLRTIDEGANWINIGLIDQGVLTLCLTSEAIYSGTNGGGVFKTTDEGASWESMNKGLIGLQVQALYSVNGVLYAGNDKGVFKAIDHSHWWAWWADNWKTIVSISASFTGIVSGMLGIFFYFKKCLRSGVEAGGVSSPLIDG